MATQTLEFNAGSGLTISCKLFALESDTVVATVTATEKTNDKNRYSVAFTSVAAGAYRLNGFVGAVGGFVNEVYDLLLVTDTFAPRSEAASNVPANFNNATFASPGVFATAALANAPTGGGATADDVLDEIENRGITTFAVQSGITNATTLELIQGDTYDGIGKPLLGFTVAVNYTSGWTATLTIRSKDDVVIATYAGVVASAASITFDADAPTGLAMTGCPGSWVGKWDLQLSKAGSIATIARGVVYVYEDQTR